MNKLCLKMGKKGKACLKLTSSTRRRRFPPVRLDLLELNCGQVVPEKEFAINLQQHRAASFRVAPSSSSKYTTTDSLANSRSSWP